MPQFFHVTASRQTLIDEANTGRPLAEVLSGNTFPIVRFGRTCFSTEDRVYLTVPWTPGPSTFYVLASHGVVTSSQTIPLAHVSAGRPRGSRKSLFATPLDLP